MAIIVISLLILHQFEIALQSSGRRETLSICLFVLLYRDEAGEMCLKVQVRSRTNLKLRLVFLKIRECLSNVWLVTRPILFYLLSTISTCHIRTFKLTFRYYQKYLTRPGTSFLMPFMNTLTMFCGGRLQPDLVIILQHENSWKIQIWIFKEQVKFPIAKYQISYPRCSIEREALQSGKRIS